jgi:hypothetical protein
LVGVLLTLPRSPGAGGPLLFFTLVLPSPLFPGPSVGSLFTLEGSLSRGSFLVGATVLETYLVSCLFTFRRQFAWFIGFEVKLSKIGRHISAMDRLCNFTMLEDWLDPSL